LARKYAADIRANSILDDLVAAGCVLVKNGMVRLVNPTYGLLSADGERLDIAGVMLRRLAETTDYNLRHADPAQRKMQRLWLQQQVPPHLVAEALRIASEIAVKAGREIDAELTKLSRAECREGEQPVEVGVGMFVYNEDAD